MTFEYKKPTTIKDVLTWRDSQDWSTLAAIDLSDGLVLYAIPLGRGLFKSLPSDTLILDEELMPEDLRSWRYSKYDILLQRANSQGYEQPPSMPKLALERLAIGYSPIVMAEPDYRYLGFARSDLQLVLDAAITGFRPVLRDDVRVAQR